MKNTLSLLIFVCAFYQCKVEKFTSTNLPEKQIEFGTGGGFAGYETSYILLENGQIFKKSGIGGKVEEYHSIKKSKAKKIYKGLGAITSLDPKSFSPGNLYSFIDVKGGEPYRITWDNFLTDVNPELKSYFQSLNDITKIEK